MTTLVNVDTQNAQLPTPIAWLPTGTTSADGKAVVKKTTKNGRNMWGVEVAPGEYKKRSHYEITTGKKPPKAKACKNEKPKASITKSKKSAAKGNGRGKPKRGERAKAMRKLMATETAEQRKRDRKKTSKHVVRTAAKYHPLHNDFAKLDTAASGK